MRRIKNWKKFNEAVGLSEPSIVFSDFLTDQFQKQLLQFLETGKSKDKITINYKTEDLEEGIQNPQWFKFPISSIDCEFEFEKISLADFQKKYPQTSKIKDWNTFGALYNLTDPSENLSYLTDPIDERAPHNIHIKMEMGVVISDEFNRMEDLMLEVESAIVHEFNHGYEGYQRFLRGKGITPTNLTWALEPNRAKIKKEVWKVWYNHIGFFLYWSEKHELNAMTQEAWPYVKKLPVDQMKEKCASWRYADMMEKFKADNFKKLLSEEILKYYPEADLNFFFKSLKSGFANELAQKESESVGEDKASISPKAIKSMTFDRFLKVVEKRVNTAGEELKKRILRLYSLKK